MTETMIGDYVALIFLSLAGIGIAMSIRNKKYNIVQRLKKKSVKTESGEVIDTEPKKTEEPKKQSENIDEVIKNLEKELDENS